MSEIVKLTNFQTFLGCTGFIILKILANQHNLYFRVIFYNFPLKTLKFSRSRLWRSHINFILSWGRATNMYSRERPLSQR